MTASRASSIPTSSIPDFSFRLSADQDTTHTHSNTSSSYSTPTPAPKMENWYNNTPEIKSMDYTEDHSDVDQDYLQVQPRSHYHQQQAAAAATTASTVAIASASAPQCLNTEQYFTMMNEAAGRVRALAEEEPVHSHSLPSSTGSFMSAVAAVHPYQQYQQQQRPSPYYPSPLGAVRRTQSIDNTSFSSSPSGSPVMVLHSQAAFQKSHDAQHGDYFGGELNMMMMNMGATTTTAAAATATATPVTINHQRRNTEPMYYPSSYGSNLSSSFLSSSSSSSSTSPSPSPPSPLMLSSSPSSTLGLPSLDRKRLSIVSTASSAPSLGHGRSHSSTDGMIKKPKARYVCHYPNCHRTFSRPFNLKSHGLTHETQRPHACDQCPKTFARVHDRDRHMKGHLTEKAHSCIVCQGRFARQDAVTRHLKLSNEQNPCAVILKSHGISFREAAAGRVKRSALGDENVIRKTLESLEEQARKLRATKNLEMGMMNMGININAVNAVNAAAAAAAMNLNHVNVNAIHSMNAMNMGMHMGMGMGMGGVGMGAPTGYSLGATPGAAGSVNGLAMSGLGYTHDLEHAFR
ncbi:hypothetical protein BGX31_006055 [Mortierella sp. GBA43]|nr:hypothetical protein BGX31_006055 [Mortierella sp. GBA43]